MKMSRPLQRYILFALFLVGILYTVYHHPSSIPYLSSSSHLPKHIDWASVPAQHATSSPLKYPNETPKNLPRIQALSASETAEQKKTRDTRRDEVKRVFVRSWKAYRDMAWTHDELAPSTGGWKDHFNGWGCTLVDSLDSLLILGLTNEFNEALATVSQIDFSVTHVTAINVFETTVRYLGGLLGAHELAKDSDGGVLLAKAKELGEMLLHAWDTQNGMPVARWNWMKNFQGTPENAFSYSLSAEVGSMFLEFTRLSQLTGDLRFFDKVQRVSNVMAAEQGQTKIPGLWPVSFNAETMSWRDETLFTLGGRADSMYEYVSKGFLMLGGNSDMHKQMYITWVEAAKEHLFFKPMNKGNLDILLAGSASVQKDGKIVLIPEAQHLTCYLGGLLAVNSNLFSRPEDLDTAKKLVDGCIWAYRSTASGIMPESFIAIPPEKQGGKNKWDKTRWLKEINQQFPIGAEDEVVDKNARAEQIVKSNKLPDGFSKVGDKRYILR
jgi:mannosyl-oligosaccharide alpha-1,2-mannosidase